LITVVEDMLVTAIRLMIRQELFHRRKKGRKKGKTGETTPAGEYQPGGAPVIRSLVIQRFVFLFLFKNAVTRRPITVLSVGSYRSLSFFPSFSYWKNEKE
jgi:hypothetical protein